MLLQREREALKAIQQLSRPTRVAISRKMNVSTEYVEYLCRRLEAGHYITGHPMRGYQLTEKGEALLEYVGSRRDIWR